jgi:hypothetical protein
VFLECCRTVEWKLNEDEFLFRLRGNKVYGHIKRRSYRYVVLDRALNPVAIVAQKHRVRSSYKSRPWPNRWGSECTGDC